MAPPDLIFPGIVLKTVGPRPNGQPLDVQIPDVVPYATFRFTDARAVQVRLHLDGMPFDMAAPASASDLDAARSSRVTSMFLPVSGLVGLLQDNAVLT